MLRCRQEWILLILHSGGIGGCPFVLWAAGNLCKWRYYRYVWWDGNRDRDRLDKVIAIAKKVQELVSHEADGYILKAGKSSELVRDLPKGQGKWNTK